MEHRLRKKHLCSNFDTNASNETFWKETQEKKKKPFFSKKKQNGQKQKNEQHESVDLSQRPFPLRPKNQFFTNENHPF